MFSRQVTWRRIPQEAINLEAVATAGRVTNQQMSAQHKERTAHGLGESTISQTCAEIELHPADRATEEEDTRPYANFPLLRRVSNSHPQALVTYIGHNMRMMTMRSLWCQSAADRTRKDAHHPCAPCRSQELTSPLSSTQEHQ